jgi:hypothetical protein
MGVFLLLMGATVVGGLHFLRATTVDAECDRTASITHSPPPPDSSLQHTTSSSSSQPPPPTPQLKPERQPPQPPPGEFNAAALGSPLRQALDQQLQQREHRFNWTGVPDCVRHHLRRFAVSQLLLEAAIDPPVARPPATPEGWTRSDLGYGTNRMFLVSYDKFKHRQQLLLDQLRPYEVESSGLLTLWEAPYLDVALIGSDAELIRCFWPKRAPQPPKAYVKFKNGSYPADFSISKREISLSLKHMTAYYYSLVFDLLPVSVIEDDAIVNATHAHVWPAAFRSAPKDWGLILAGWCLARSVPPEYGDYLAGRRGRKQPPLCSYGYMISAIGVMGMFRGTAAHDHTTAHAHSTRAALRSFLVLPAAVGSGVIRAIDLQYEYVCRHQGVGCYYMDPRPIGHQVAHDEPDALGHHRNKYDKR